MPLSRAEAIAIIDKARTPEKKEDDALEALATACNVPRTSLWGQGSSAKIGATLQRLNFLIRRPIMTRIAGQLREPLEHALKEAKRMPYQQGGTRLPFRAKNVADASDAIAGTLAKAMARNIGEFNQPLEWWALWIGYVEGSFYHDTKLDVLFANAIDGGDLAMLDTLIRSVEMTHETAVTSRTAIRALLRSNNPRAWQTVEQLLVRAKGAEGLRQAIVECADELNPENFKKMLRLIVEYDLLRFSSVIRAFIIWFPDLMAEGSPKSGEKVVMRLLEFLEQPDSEPEPTYTDTYLRLWADAFFDVDVAIRRADVLFKSSNLDVRRAVASIAGAILLTTAKPLILKILVDPDLPIVEHGVNYAAAMRSVDRDPELHVLVLEAAKKWPKKAPADISLSRNDVWLIAYKHAALSDLPLYCEHLDELPSAGRMSVANNLQHLKDKELQHRMLLRLAGDTTLDAREIAFKSLAKTKLSQEDALYFEGLLTRTAQSLRTPVINLLVAQPDPAALASAQRLAEGKHRLQREAAADIATALVQRGVKQAVSLAKEIAPATPDWKLADVFGLMDISKVTFCPLPKARAWGASKDRIRAMLVDLDALIHEHRDERVLEYRYAAGAEQSTFGNIEWHYMPTRMVVEHIKDWPQEPAHFEFIATIRGWLAGLRQKHSLQDEDFFEALCMSVREHWRGSAWPDEVRRSKQWPDLRYLSFLSGVLDFAVVDSLSVDGTLGGLLWLCHELKADKYVLESEWGSSVDEKSWRQDSRIERARKLLQRKAESKPTAWSTEDWRLAFQIYRLIDEPFGAAGRTEADKIQDELDSLEAEQDRVVTREKAHKRRINVPPRQYIPLVVVEGAFAHGLATEADYIDQIRLSMIDATQHDRSLSPTGQRLVRRVVDKVVEVECGRGSVQGPATVLSMNIRGAVGLTSVLRMLQVVGELSRTTYFVSASTMSREQSLTRLMSHSRPFPEETPETCAKEFRKLNIKPARFVELAVLSPYWAGSIELAFGWSGFEDAVWWLHAHTKADNYNRHDNVADAYEGAVSERTSLTLSQLELGHCDAAWFHKFNSTVDPALWKLITNRIHASAEA